MRARATGPALALAAIVALLCAAAVLDTLAGAHSEGAGAILAYTLLILPSAAIGWLIARRTANPIGRLLLANAGVLALLAFSDTYSEYAVLEHPGALPGAAWAVLFGERGWPLMLVPITAIAWVFPDGRLPSPRWKPWATAAVTAVAGLLVISFLAGDRFSADYAHVDSPLPELPESVIGIPFALFGIASVGTLLGGALAVRTRFRRATGIERLQLKWLTYAAILIPAIVGICLLEIALVGHDGIATFAAMVAAMTAVPAAVGVAVLRYRLYEIDRLINRTLVYGTLTACLALVFAAVSLLLGTAIGRGAALPTAAATLAVAMLFAPLRARAQLVVDRRFARARFDGLQRVKRHLEDLRAGRASPEATGAVLADALGDPSLAVLFWVPEAGAHVDAAGRAVDEAAYAGRARTPVRRGDLHLATVVHDPALQARPDLLESVIAAAGLAIEVARLRVEVRRQLAEVEASRARIVAAGDAERRRLERDLHDGVQQRLVSIGLGLRHVQAGLEPGGPTSAALDATVGELAGAIEELRELARGVRPAGLDDGLAPALRELAARSRLRTTVDATGDRFDERIETAAYFVASEALANAAKHARASEVALRAARDNGSLIVSVADDGVGGAAAAGGSGLEGIEDRVSALGGRVTVESRPGDGTVVTAVLPCGS